MWFVYILFCDQKIYYVGITQDIQKRFDEHVNGLSQFTSQFSDIELVCKEAHRNKQAAEKRERQIKGWSKAKKTALIKGDLKQLIQLSRSSDNLVWNGGIQSDS